MSDNNNWKEYSKLVLHELETHTTELKSINENIKLIEKDIIMLKVKAGMWGAIAGMIPVAIVILINLLT